MEITTGPDSLNGSGFWSDAMYRAKARFCGEPSSGMETSAARAFAAINSSSNTLRQRRRLFNRKTYPNPVGDEPVLGSIPVLWQFNGQIPLSRATLKVGDVFGESGHHWTRVTASRPVHRLWFQLVDRW